MRQPAQLRRLGHSVRALREAWIARRIPAAREVRLDRGNIFIFPTGSGFAFLALLLALLLTGINYESNLVFALAFLLAGLFVVGVLHTYANLAQLRVTGAGAEAVFAGAEAGFVVQLADAGRRVHDGLLVGWEGNEGQGAHVPHDGAQTLTLFLRASHRGWLRAPRVRIASAYPLGLLRAWTSLDLAQRCVVYPRPATAGDAPLASRGGDEGPLTHDPGSEDFAGFRDYRSGDPLRHVVWKTLARGQRLQTLDQRAFADRSRWLRWSDTEWGTDVESRLALLCRWVLELQAQGSEYGLELPGCTLQPASGDAQCEQALTALALFGGQEPPA
ncbi:MAG: hypothetical protein CALGDGBN_01725 [Pseudomonadales bacterium]|nr:hypothetical protein [Pseudomonadales bacterium]